MTEKTAKALYGLLKELYQSRTAKDFVDVYEHEEHEQRHFAQAAPVNRNEERNKAFMALTDAIFTSGNITEVQQAAKAFVDICNREERKKPKVGEVYRDIFGNRYIVIGVHDLFPDGEPVKKPFVMLIYSNAKGELRSSEVFTVSLEDFLNPTFKKV